MKKINKTLSALYFVATAFVAQAQTPSTSASVPNNEEVTIKNEKTVNTNKLEFSPTFFEDGIVFLSSNALKDEAQVRDKKISERTFNIKRARRGPQGLLTEPEIYVKTLASVFHEGPLCFDKTTENVYFSRNNSADGKLIQVKCKETGETCARQQIYCGQKQGEDWTNIKPLSFNKGEYAYRHPSLSLDGKKLYFSSNCPGGLGGYDIWMSTKIGEEWGEPVNAGSKINTALNEGFPFIHADGTLLFASDGRGGVGGLDMFYALAEKGKGFQEPQNIGTPFNSIGDDFGLILDLDRKNGYFTSNRASGAGSDDIYSFTSPEPIINPKKKDKALICVLDKADESPINEATVKYSNIAGYNIGELSVDAAGNVSRLATTDNINILQIVNDQPSKVLTTDATCKAEFVVEDGDYVVNVSKEGYAPKQLIIKAKQDIPLYKVYLEKANGQLVTGVLKSDRGLPIAGAMVTITDPETGEVQNVTTDAQGKYTFLAKPKKKYNIAGNKPNHDPMTSTFETPEGNVPKEYAFNGTMKEVTSKLSKGRVFELTNVYYNFNDASLRPDARHDLEALVLVMKAYPEVEIELGSHTDCRGSDTYNDNLSQRRAESVVRYLVENDVSKTRLTARGYGEHKLRNQCADGVECTEEDHQRNRRTEVTITQGASNAEIIVVDKEPEYTDPMPGRKVGGPAIADGHNVNNSTPSSYSTDESNSGVVIANSDPNGMFWVVAGSYNNQKNAVEQQVKLMNRGFQETSVEYAEDIHFYRVVVSKQATHEAAETIARTLKVKGIADLFVVKR